MDLTHAKIDIFHYSSHFCHAGVIPVSAPRPSTITSPSDMALIYAHEALNESGVQRKKIV